MESMVRNYDLAPQGAKKIAWVRSNMPILAVLEEQFIKEQPFKGLTLAMSIHMEAKTARTALLFKAGGAKVFATGCNPLSTQDDVAAALALEGVAVNAWYDATEEEYHEHLIRTLSCKPHLIVDDGGDLTQILLDSVRSGRKPDGRGKRRQTASCG